VEGSKLHRRPYNPPFSRPAVIKKEDLIRSKIKTVIDALDKACDTSDVIDISSYYRALTTDVIASFSFGENNDMDLLHNLDKAERLYATWRGAWKRMARYRGIGRPGGWIQRIVSWLPARPVSEEDTEGVRAFIAYHEVRGALKFQSEIPS
jgi:cytochrome P450